MENKTFNNSIIRILKDIYIDIELSKKFIIDFKTSFCNNNFKNMIGVVAIKKHILFNLFDSFEQTIRNIEIKIIKLQQEINNKKKSNLKYNLKKNDYNRNRTNSNFNVQYNSENTNNNDKFKDQVNCINNISNFNYKINNKTNILSEENENKNIDNNNKIGNYTLRNPGTILKKIYDFNIDSPLSNNLGKRMIGNMLYQNETFINKNNKFNKNINYYYNYSLPNNGISKKNSSISKSIRQSKYFINLNNNTTHNSNSNKKNNNLNIENGYNSNIIHDIKIKSPIREIIKKLIKNKNEINESFLNYSNISGGIHNRSFDYNNKNDSIIEKIKNSDDLNLYFSEKYGHGDINIFINKYKKNKINRKKIEKEIRVMEKIIEKNNNRNISNGIIVNSSNSNINNKIYNNESINLKKMINKSSRFVKKNKNKKKIYKINRNSYMNSKYINPSKNGSKINRTVTQSNKGIKKINNQKNTFDIKNKNYGRYQNSNSYGDNCLKTDEFNIKKYNIAPQIYYYENKNNYNNLKRFKTPTNNTSSLTSYSIL